MKKKNLRSRQWFDNPKDPENTALYLERYLNYGLTRKELQSGNPIIELREPIKWANNHPDIIA